MQDLKPNPLKWAMAPEGSSEETKVVPGAKPKSTRQKPPSRSTRKRTAEAATPLPHS
jgi:hypothetical protein